MAGSNSSGGWLDREVAADKRRLERGVHYPLTAGRRAGICHKDYMLAVPVYRYIRPCQHMILYREPIPWAEWGWCPRCREPFQHDNDTREIAPAFHTPGKRAKLIGDELSALIDRAIVRNRVADLVWETGTEELSDEQAHVFAKALGCGTTTIYEVAADMGVEISLE